MERLSSRGASLARFFRLSEERWEGFLLMALVVGLLSGVLAVALRSAVHALFHALEPARLGPAGILIPAFGALIGVMIVRDLFQEPAGHGVPAVIRAVCLRGGRMRVRAIASRWLGSLANVGAGGSAGLEGPIVYSAGALGAVVAERFGLDERRRSILVGCGVAGGISAIFNAPMTGLIFATEIILAEWSAFSIVPVAISAVAATELSRVLLGNEQSFLHAPFEMGVHDLIACIGLGLLSGAVAAALSSGIARAQGIASRLHGRFAPFALGLGVGAIGLAFPMAIGEGYEGAQAAVSSQQDLGILLAVGLLLAKLVATSMTLGSGAPGGMFAPSLVSGAFLGTAFHRIVERIQPVQLQLASEGSYAIVGMSGMVAGVMHAPLTGIFLVMEVTDGYDVILPLMIVSVLSLVVARRFDRHSLYTKELASSGELRRPGTDRQIGVDLSVRDVLDGETIPVHEDLTLEELAEAVRSSSRNHFPVVDRSTGALLGMLDLARVRRQLLDPQLARITLVGTVMETKLPEVLAQAPVSQALEAFERTGQWVLPVVDDEGRFVGLISKSRLFDHYRRELLVQDRSVDG